MPLNFGVDIKSQTKVRVRKPKNPIWPLGGHFEINVAENQYAPTHIHKYCATEVWSWSSEPNESSSLETKNAKWPPGGHFESDVAENQQAPAYDHHQYAYEIWNWNSKANLTYIPETMPPTESRNRKKQYGRQVAILKMTSLKINRLLPIYISIVPLKFGLDIQSQTKVRVWKPKNPIWPPGSHFESDVAENQ